MFYLKKVIFVVVLFVLFAGCATKNREFSTIVSKDAYVDIGEAENVKIIYDDTKTLFRLYDKYKKDDGTIKKSNVDAFVDEYKNSAVDGVLYEFSQRRYKNSEDIYREVIDFLPFYNSYREDILREDLIDKEYVIEAFKRLREFIPDAKLPNIYVFIGLMNNGGTITSKGIIIAAEIFHSNLKDYSLFPMPKLVPMIKPMRLKRFDANPIVVHELMHYIQFSHGNIDRKKLLNSEDLLTISLIEGGAEFLSTVINKDGRTNSYFKAILDEYFEDNKLSLWSAFKEDIKNGKDANVIKKWLYNAKTAKDRPADLGYAMGFYIMKNYYESAKDKKEAFIDILRFKEVGEQVFLDAYEKSL